MSIEIRKDSQYTFTYEKIRSDLPQLITSATISIFDPKGNEMLAETDMSIAINVATYNQDFSVDPTGFEFDLGQNYKVIYTIDGEVIAYLFDIVLYPFVNPVTDQDLITENEIVRRGVWEVKGQADSGSTTTILDTERTEANESWYGGVLEVLPLDDANQITKHQINDYDRPTNTLTFEPARNVAITTENYVLRRSYKAQIDLAGEKVGEDLAKNAKRIALLLDSTQCKRLVIYKFFETYFQAKRQADGDSADLQFKYYSDKYAAELLSIKLDYDADEDGVIDEEEKAQSDFVVEVTR